MNTIYNRPSCAPGGATGWFLALCIGMGLLYSAVAWTQPNPAPHAQAVAAVGDVQTAVNMITQAEDSMSTGPDFFQHAAQRSINTLVGSNDAAYRASAGSPASASGAIGHMNALLHLAGAHPWNAPVHGAWVNTMVAVASLRQALNADDLDDFQADMTQALSSLEIALGRASATGTLGGLEGALANTELGIPAGAKRVSACTAATQAPAYGVTQGYLAFYAVPIHGNGPVALPQVFGERRIQAHDGLLILHTAAAPKVAKLCAQAANSASTAAETKRTSKTPHTTAAQPSSPSNASAMAAAKSKTTAKTTTRTAQKNASPGSHSSLPAVYEKSQAHLGKGLFASHCASCHGDNAQGASAPANAGTAFLSNAHQLGWSISDLRYMVVNTMPLNDPGSLAPKQYSEVIAYLLASSCYPAGHTAFPTHDEPRLKKAKLAPLKKGHADKPKLGICTVH